MKAATSGFITIAESGSAYYYTKVTSGGTDITDKFVDMKYFGRINAEENICIGSACASYVEFKVYDPSISLENLEIQVFEGIMVSGSIEYKSLGYFTVMNPAEEDGFFVYKAYDRMVSKLNQQYISGLSYPNTIENVLNEVSALSGVGLSSSGNSTVISSEPIGYTYREMLEVIAGLNGKNCIINESGLIEFRWYTNNGYSLDEDYYYDGGLTLNSYVDYVVNKIICKTGTDENGDDILITSGTGSNYIYIENEFMTQAILDNIFSSITGFTYRPLNISFSGDIRVECGDIITVTRGTDTFYVPIMSIEHNIDGGIVTEVSSYSQTEIEQEVNYTGSILQSINALTSATATAQSTADGKNTVYYSAIEPTGGSYSPNDLWFDTDDGYKMYQWNGSAWVGFQLGTNAIADASIVNAKIADATIQSAKIQALDAGKVTTGFLSSDRIQAGSLSIGKLDASANATISAIKTTSTNGGLKTITDAVDSSILITEIEGLSTQATTPTPSAPVNILNCEDGLLTVCGKNLFDGILSAGNYLDASGNIAVYAQRTTSTNYIPVASLSTVAIKNYDKTGTLRISICEYDSNKTFIVRNAVISNGTSKTLQSNTKYIRFSLSDSLDADVSSALQFQVEYATVSTAYEAYKCNSVDLTGVNLKSNGSTTKDRIYFDSTDNLWKLQTLIGTKVFDGTEAITKNDGNAGDYLYYCGSAVIPKAFSTAGLCSHLPHLTITPFGDVVGCYFGLGNQFTVFNFGSAIMTTNTAVFLKAWMASQYTAGTPVIFNYVLSTPTTTVLSDALQTALNSLASYTGTTNITLTSDTNGVVEVNYATSFAGAITLTNRASTNYSSLNADTAQYLLDSWTATGTTEIDGGKIKTDSVTALQIYVANLSALSADLGTVTAGVMQSPNYVAGTTGSKFDLTNGTLETNSGIFRGSITTDTMLAGTVASTVVSNASTGLANANTALANASTAQTTADGKNTVYYQTSAPIGGTYKINDIWFDTDDGYRLYQWNGTTWTAFQLGSNAIADLAITNAKIADATILNAKIATLDAGKVTTGYLSSDRIAANSITSSKLQIGTSGYCVNPNFSNWTDTYPYGFANWLTYSDGVSKVTEGGSNYLQMECLLNASQGIKGTTSVLPTSCFNYKLDLSATKYIAVEYKFRLTSGTNPSGAGIYIDFYYIPAEGGEEARKTIYCPASNLGTDLTLSTWYTYRKIHDIPSEVSLGRFTSVSVYVLGNSSDLGTRYAKTIQFSIVDIFPATEQEFLAQDWTSVGTTTIDGGKITADSITATQVNVDDLFAEDITFTGKITGGSGGLGGTIQSANYIYSESGTKIDLSDGKIDTKNFKVNPSGSLMITGGADIRLASTDLEQSIMTISHSGAPGEMDILYCSAYGVRVSQGDELYPMSSFLSAQGLDMYDDIYNTASYLCSGIGYSDGYGDTVSILGRDIYISDTSTNETVHINGNVGEVALSSGVTMGNEGSLKGKNTSGTDIRLAKVSSSDNAIFSSETGISKTYIYGGTEAQTYITGQAYITGNCSALSFTDRTPFYEGDALSDIKKIKGNNGEIDHSTLPKFAQKQLKNTTNKIKTTPLKFNGSEDIMIDEIETIETIEEGRDLGAMISVLTVAIQQLTDINEQQNKRIKKLEELLMKK